MSWSATVLLYEIIVLKNDLIAIYNGEIPQGENTTLNDMDRMIYVIIDGINNALYDFYSRIWRIYQIRSLSYPDTDVFIVLFSIIDSDSYNHVETIWKHDIECYYQDAPIILVGSCTEVTKNPEKINGLAEQGMSGVIQRKMTLILLLKRHCELI